MCLQKYFVNSLLWGECNDDLYYVREVAELSILWNDFAKKFLLVIDFLMLFGRHFVIYCTTVSDLQLSLKVFCASYVRSLGFEVIFRDQVH